MNYRHPNRSRTGLKPNRNDLDRQKFVETYEVPVIKIGRYVDFGRSREFSGYLNSVAINEDNEYGFRKGWFSLVDSPIFVEYADLTKGLATMLRERSRPRSFGNEIIKATASITKSIRDTTRERGLSVISQNTEREIALQTAIDNNDHVEEFSQYEFLTRATSEWEERAHILYPQPRATAQSNEGAVVTYGYPIANSKDNMSVRSQLAEIISGEGIPVPDSLLKADMNVVPVMDLHIELSAMKSRGPVLGSGVLPQEITLGPVEIHKF